MPDTINVILGDLDYIPDYKKYEQNRQTNEIERINNEKGRQELYNLINQRLLNGELKGEKGDQGNIGNGILKIEKTATNGLIDTYTITYTDRTTTTLEIKNGEKYDDTNIRQIISNVNEKMEEKIDASVVEPLISNEVVEPKNIYNYTNEIIGSIGTDGNVIQNENSNFKVSDFIKLDPGEAYSFSYSNQTQGRYHLVPNRLVIFDISKQFLEQTTSFTANPQTQLENGVINFSYPDRLLTFTPNKDCYIRIMSGISLSEIMIAKGTDINYEEYFETYIKREIKENAIDKKHLSKEVQNIIDKKVEEEDLSEELKTKVNSVAGEITLPTELQEKIKNIEEFCLNMFLYNRAICIGDSLTEGYHYAQDIRKHKSYPTFLKMLTNWEIENAGQSGITTAGWWNAYKDKYDFSNYDIAFIYLGTNGGLTDTLQEDTAIEEGQTYENYANTNTGSYCKIIEKALEQNPDIKIILIRWDGTVSANTTIKIAEKYGLETINLLDGKYFNLQDPKYHTDSTHYNSMGYLCFARNIYLHLKDMLKENTIETEEV